MTLDEGDKSLSLEDLVKHYLNHKSTDWAGFEGIPLTAKEAHESYLSALDDITDFICGQKNETKVPDGPPYVLDEHQWNLRFPRRLLIVNDMARRLKDIDHESFNDFEELIAYVEKRRVPHFGDTAVYDFALRYGWKQTPRLNPEKFVYIHSKPRRSAVRLYQLGYLEEIGRCLPLEKYNILLLPGMTAADVEHFLCVYHDEIMKLKKKQS